MLINETTDITKIFEECKADFPDKAYAEDNSRGFPLTTLKAQYIIERLNVVFGINGWDLTGEFIDKDKGVLFLGELKLFASKEGVKEILHTVDAVGYADNKKNMGDTYKSSRTDALSKAASFIGIGNDMFKGEIKVGKTSTSFNKSEPKVEAKKSSFRRPKKKEMEDDI